MAEINWTATPGRDHVYAPDGSEIRPLLQSTRASMVHTTLPPGGISRAVRHQSVEEFWYFLDGEGEVWRRFDGREETVAVRPGVAIYLPVGASFQFRATGREALTFVIVTIPPWPGEQEAVRADDHWPST